MNIIENIKYDTIEKLSYGWPTLDDLHMQILKQYNIKGDCKIGLLKNTHLLFD